MSGGDDRMAAVRAKLGRIGYGADYNPEHWPQPVRDEDLTLMADAGVSLVTAGIFSWAEVEPREGEYDFGYFDATMDGLAETGVSVCLATMTASPPPWLSHRYPETLPRTAAGTILSPGGRQHFCPSSPVYREHAGRLVEQLATRYANHPALALWHVGNEFACHIRACYCDVSAADFRRWLIEKYGDIDALNAAWSTTFWAQRYADFAEILPPRVAPTFPNPAQQIDFARFSSDAQLDCYLAEKAILRRLTPDVPVTTNYVGLVQKALDWYRWAPHQDVAAIDSYPDPYDPRAHVEAAFSYDLIRSVKGGQPWLLLEQAPSAVNWRERNAPKAPGLMRLWSWQAVAQGADAVVFFQWRQTAGGAEKFHSAMVPHGGTNTRTWREARALGHELASVPELAGSTVRAEVALLHDWNSWWGLELDSHPSADLNLLDAHLAHYGPLFDAHVTCDVVHPSGDLSGYRLVVVPNLYLLDAADAARLTSYVEGGGILVVSFFSGIVDPDDRAHLGGHPAPLREVLGLRVDEFWPLPTGGTVGLAAPALSTPDARGTIWSEWIEPEGAEVVATFADGELAGRPAITRHRYGAGTAWYLGTRPDPATLRALFDRVLAEAGTTAPIPGLPPSVQATRRRSADADYLFLLNHGTEPVTVSLPQPAVDLLTDRNAPVRAVTLAARGVAVLRG
ncbi:beta-galactosidase [Actinocatenispora thailandica]|uniref:Beta-galactosidase n=1 Tax=Actinocatenispora thailandica TaxID=227318 RepID=A0A7R7DVE7_9ACTN|nr:beta-galactosidase [Actinocatenispora thailandica]BCJ38435.1 beta-galactosidase [Actinocatenispora thailandica]